MYNARMRSIYTKQAHGAPYAVRLAASAAQHDIIYIWRKRRRVAKLIGSKAAAATYQSSGSVATGSMAVPVSCRIKQPSTSKLWHQWRESAAASSGGSVNQYQHHGIIISAAAAASAAAAWRRGRNMAKKYVAAAAALSAAWRRENHQRNQRMAAAS